jgi:hypothetical protein
VKEGAVEDKLEERHEEEIKSLPKVKMLQMGRASELLNTVGDLREIGREGGKNRGRKGGKVDPKGVIYAQKKRKRGAESGEKRESKKRQRKKKLGGRRGSKGGNE